MENELTKLREQIDKVDDKIVSLLSERMKLVEQVGKLKKNHNVDPVDMKRFKEVLDGIKYKAQRLGLSDAYIEDLYNVIHDHSLKTERKQ